MPELSDSTIRYIIMGVIGLGLWLAYRWFRARPFKKLAAKLEPEAKSRGWTYQSSGAGGTQKQLFEGNTGGIAWKLKTYDRPATSDPDSRDIGESYSQWETESASLPLDMIVILGYAWRLTKPDQRKKQLPDTVKKAIDADKSEKELFKRVGEVKSGSESLRARFVVMASSEGGVEQFLNRGADNALTTWPGEPTLDVAALYPRGLRIKLVGTPENFQQVAALVDLGVGLAKAAGGK